MKTHSLVRLLTGLLVLASIALAFVVSPWWLALAAFVGINLFQSSLTGFCSVEYLLDRLGWRGTNGSDEIGPAKLPTRPKN